MRNMPVQELSVGMTLLRDGCERTVRSVSRAAEPDQRGCCDHWLCLAHVPEGRTDLAHSDRRR